MTKLRSTLQKEDLRLPPTSRLDVASSPDHRSVKPVNHLLVKKVVCSSAALRSKRYKDTEKRKQTKDTEIRIKNKVQAQVSKRDASAPENNQ